MLVAQGLLPGGIVYSSKLAIDSFVSAKNTGDFADLEKTIWLFLCTGFLLLATDSLRFLNDWVRSAQGEFFSDYLKTKMHEKAVEVDFEFYESSKYHDLMEQASGESQSKPLALLENLGSVIQSSITLITFAALLMAYGWAVPFILLIGALPSLFVSLVFDKRYFNWWENTASERRWLFYYDGMVTQSDPAAEMRIFGLGKRFAGTYQDLRKSLRSKKLSHLFEQSAGKVVANTLALITGSVAMGWIAMRVYYNTATLGDLAVFYQVFSRGQTIIGGLLGSIGKMVSNSLYLKSLFSYLELEAKIVSPENAVPFPDPIREGLRFDNVTFRYPGSEAEAVSDFSLFIPAKRQVALVGENGAGKSTLVKLLCRLYDPDQGSIEIDGIDIRKFDIAELRRNISILFQFPMRFQATAIDNISFGDIGRPVDAVAIQHAAEGAGADRFIERLSKGYQTLLGRWFENGSELSGGEWQKLALARAYYRRSQLIVLDEPTSFMDSWAEADWFDRFRDLAEDSTGLLITHRFTIAMRADIIHVIDDGSIIESGTHSELLALNGLYANSWNSQMAAARASVVD